MAGVYLLRRVEVAGHSMLPTLRDGDRMLAVRCKRARPGEVVVFRDPRSPHRLLVKRLVAMKGGRAIVRGDNSASSTDSSIFGTVRVEARVLYRYAPRERTGWIGRGRGYHRVMGDAPSELDQLLATDFVERLEDLPMEELRARKSHCERVEAEISYFRRLVQGRLDIINAELRRREGGENGGLAEIVDHLPEILSEGVRGAKTGRRITEMSGDVDHRRLTAELDRIVDVDTFASLASMGQEEVAVIAAALVELEQRVSSQRRSLHECQNTVQAEIIRRYKSGEATVDSLLP